MSDKLISIRAAAKILGLHHSVLAEQVNKGLIPTHGGKVYASEVEEARARFVATKAGKAPETVKPGKASAKASSDALSFATARAKKEAHRAALLGLELQVKEGKLVALDVVQRTVEQWAREQRDAWQMWPARVAPLMAAEVGVDAGVLLVALERHVRDFLAERAGVKYRGPGVGVAKSRLHA